MCKLIFNSALQTMENKYFWQLGYPYLAQLWTHTGATDPQKIMELWIKFWEIIICLWFSHFALSHGQCVPWEIHCNELLLCYLYFWLIFGIYADEPMQSLCCCHWHHLWTVILATGVITETSYLAHTCTYTSSVCIWNIRSILCVFFKWHPF